MRRQATSGGWMGYVILGIALGFIISYFTSYSVGMSIGTMVGVRLRVPAQRHQGTLIPRRARIVRRLDLER